MGRENAPNSGHTDFEFFFFFINLGPVLHCEFAISLNYEDIVFFMVAHSFLRGFDVFVEPKQP